MTESTALALLSPEEQAYLDSLDDGVRNNESSGLPRLEINMVSRDSEGNKQVIGAWHLEGTDKYFDGPVTFRPVRWFYKLIQYAEGSGGAFKFVGESTYFKDFRDEIIDSTGGLALGRKFGGDYTKEEKDASKKAKGAAQVYADAFGFVTFGDSDPMPCMLRARGGKQMELTNALGSIPKDKKFQQYGFILEAFQEEADGSTPKERKYKEYWSMKVTPDLSKLLPITPILQFDADIMEFVRESNHKVLESHKKGRAKKEDNRGGASAKVVNEEVLPPTRNYADDELPF